MSDKLDDLVAKQEIYELACRYSRGLDRLDAELLRSVFHPDGWCDYGFVSCSPDCLRGGRLDDGVYDREQRRRRRDF